jgi:hypothetical protein
VPPVIFAGPRTPENLYHRENANLFVKILCGPCWVQESRAEGCGYDLDCLRNPSLMSRNRLLRQQSSVINGLHRRCLKELQTMSTMELRIFAGDC